MLNNIKKIMLCLIFLGLATTVNAEYRVQLNGSLINGENIRFVNGTPPVVVPPVEVPQEECSTDNQTRWIAGTSSFQVLYVIWNNVKLFETGEYLLKEKVFDGYKYTKGEMFANAGDYAAFKVCRIKI